MPRTKKPYKLFQRNNGVFYWWPDYATGWQSTGCTNRTDAERWAVSHYDPKKAPQRARKPLRATTTLRTYLEVFYTENCPHVQRLRTEGKSIGDYHTRACRALIDNKILPDPIADLPVQSLRRHNLLDFRNRLRAANGARTVNRTMAVLKVAFKEGLFREELDHDPTAGIGNIKYQIDESGVFTEAEIAALFAESPGPWDSAEVYTVFLVIYSLGLRRGEALGLQWGDIDFEAGVVHIRRTMQNNGQVKLPKWNKTREVPLPAFTAACLKEHRAGSLYVLPQHWVFCDEIGEHRKPALLNWRFQKAMKAIGIDARTRHLRIHSFRHSAHSHLLAKGCNQELLRVAFGWSTISVQQGYTHLSGADLKEQARIIDGQFRSGGKHS